MAGQADISSILAALAQRPASNPAQPPQQGPPGGMPQGYPQNLGPAQMPTPSLGGFPLPQPSSSGSVDLSAIRPVNTGSVSIAEAIAKAKSIAADRGISYDNRPPQQQIHNQPPRGDPRLAGRPPYQQSRSRSRSPPRRDNFRGNFNPYRDERRDADRRDRGYNNRDRSHSPGPRGGRGNFSPGPGARGGPRSPTSRAPPGDSDTISVKSALVGLVIGRNGENLRRVESESGARVQFIPAKEPNAVNRQCTISGPPQARELAKQEIFRVMDENGGSVPPERGPPMSRQQQPMMQQSRDQQPALREGENSVQIMVPDKTVGLIIGRGGETIRDLQERSGCHVNIVSENKSINGMRPVNLIGTPDAARIAKEMILEIVESDVRPPPGHPNHQPAQQMDSRGPAPFDPYRGAMNNDRGGADKITEEIYVPSEAVGMIIGKGGETIKEMQATTGCKINVGQPEQPDVQRRIGLVGSRSAIDEAKGAIWEKVDTVQQRDRNGGAREQRAPRNDTYGGNNQYSQQPQQQAYGQMPMGGAAQAMSALQGMSATPQQAPASDPNAADPYAPYGGYQAYCAMWYAALAQNGQGGQGQPQMPPQ
ncbi:eukaryotic type KH-domain (KH-domain type I) [Aureobasidium pullulans]|uniref:Eukaryotic type KH-domain (KH-domain type I) n=1 Tax=Aureobasidium pullulans TaxID=5580 RepID=A0AB74K6G7_AURPU|nr:eukaryotic type KH-domain (KH-domain type I) [Aureobasidium pullulans]THX52687.1 eukaryotic type KH-domain (KH-domain type I) [Aureobasidium pullulans]